LSRRLREARLVAVERRDRSEAGGINNEAE